MAQWEAGVLSSFPLRLDNVIAVHVPLATSGNIGNGKMPSEAANVRGVSARRRRRARLWRVISTKIRHQYCNR